MIIDVLLVSTSDKEFALLQSYEVRLEIINLKDKDPWIKRSQFAGGWIMQPLDRLLPTKVEYASARELSSKKFDSVDDCKIALMADLQQFIKLFLADTTTSTPQTHI